MGYVFYKNLKLSKGNYYKENIFVVSDNSCYEIEKRKSVMMIYISQIKGWLVVVNAICYMCVYMDFYIVDEYVCVTKWNNKFVD
jgi:hypothetical protein